MGVYEELGVVPIINASGAVTRLGGAPMSQAALEAMGAAAGESVAIEELQAAASRVIAEVTGAEAGLVTTGAAAALLLGAAGMLTRDDPGRMERLPNCAGFPHQFVVAREHRNGYDHAVRATGAQLVEVGLNDVTSGAGMRRVEAWEYAAAFTPQTAGVLYVLTAGGQPPLADVVLAAHAHYLPVLVDAAGELPPRANLKSIIAAGADLVAFSGGKAIRGPQATGILCGRRDLVGAAAVQMLDMDDHPRLWQPPIEWFNSDKEHRMPRQGIGRGLKVGKEQIVALLVALRMFGRGAYDDQLGGYRARLERIATALAECPVRCRLIEGDDECLPILDIQLDERAVGRSAFDVCAALRAGSPRCFVGHWALGEGKLIVNPLHLDDARAQTLARRLREELSRGTA